MITAYPRILFHGYRRYTYEIAVINAHKAALIVKHKPDMLSTFFFFFFLWSVFVWSGQHGGYTQQLYTFEKM